MLGYSNHGCFNVDVVLAVTLPPWKNNKYPCSVPLETFNERYQITAMSAIR
jgi:hypothetical protein